MRIERTGKIDPLTPRVEKFIRKALGGRSLDNLQSPSTLRADYICLNGLVAIELKSLEDSGSERIDNLLDELRKRPDWPVFLGSAPLQSFINNTNDPDGLGNRVLERVGRGVMNPLKKANRQLEAHQINFNRKNLVKLLVLVNEDHEAYDPHAVSYILWHAVRREENGQPRFLHVDGIIYLTERHATIIDNLVTFPIVSVEGSSVFDQSWKSDVIEFVQQRWTTFNGLPVLSVPTEVSSFSTIDHIPESAPRHERWRTDYHRNPYLRKLTRDDLRKFFDEIMLVSELGFLKNPPIKIAPDTMSNVMERFTHMMEEMAHRAIPATQFEYQTERAVAAAHRLKLPQNVIDWISYLDNKKEHGS